jgi:hypothetical protein
MSQTAEINPDDASRVTKIYWHRLFGLTLMDLLANSNYQVELEKELSLKKQYLDVVIIRKTLGNPLNEMPAGLEQLAEHNLLTYKSLQEPLDEWAIEELIGHYTNYRKLVSPSLDNLLPANHFQLYAVSTRYPNNLLNKRLSFQKVQQGVFELVWGKRLIKLIVLNRIALEQKNAFWLLFSGQAKGFGYGDQHYHWRHPSERALLNQLYELYQKEGVVMPYTMEDFNRDFTRDHLHLLPPEERLRGLPPEERLRGLPPEAVFKQFSPEERLKGLALETIFNQFSPEMIEAYLSKIKGKE